MTHRLCFTICLSVALIYALLDFVQVATAQDSLREVSKIARKVDEYNTFLDTDSLAARLDYSIVNELQKSPNLLEYIIAYNGLYKEEFIRRGKYLRRIYGIKRYLIEARGVLANRIVLIDGGYREKPVIESWILPQGASPPTPTPTINEKEDITKVLLFDSECLHCEPAVNIDLFALDLEGIKFYAKALNEEISSRAYIIIYSDKDKNYPKINVSKIARETKKLLVKNFQIDPHRIFFSFGGYREIAQADFWIVPKGVRLPVPTPNIWKR